MANWLQKLIPPSVTQKIISNLPAVQVSRPPAAYTGSKEPPKDATLPNATIVYGIAAGVFFAIACCFFVSGSWFTGFVVLLPTAAMLGFAIHFLKARD